jgi:16S rRNA (cytosine967-C5)-methyltransferase
LTVSSTSRQLAFLALRAIDRGAFADVAVDRALNQSDLSPPDRRLLTELVYGSVRRQRSLDALITQLGKKPADQQPDDLRLIFHIGLYQLRYLSQIPASAAVNTSVDLAKQNGFVGLTGFVNGLLRQYVRLAETETDPLQLPTDPIARLGLRHSYPDWIIRVWVEQLGVSEAELLAEWMNRSPRIDLRVNPLRSSLETVTAAMEAVGIAVSPIPQAAQGLRLPPAAGAIQSLPGFDQGWWMVQDGSAQLVAQLVDPQPGETIVDACAAPGGKTMHLAELMQDRGTVWACDRTASRLRKLKQNADRLGLQSIRICEGDSRHLPQFHNQVDRVLIDAPCSGLGTLHRHADARWRQTPTSVQELAHLQSQLLAEAATWVRPSGVLVYATCTLHPAENEATIAQFLSDHPNWSIEPPAPDSPLAEFALPEGWLKVWPHRADRDGFFMVRLRAKSGTEV